MLHVKARQTANGVVALLVIIAVLTACWFVL